MSALVVLVTLLAVYCLWGWLMTRFGLRRLSVARHFSSRTVSEGDTGELVEVVRNDQPMLIPWLRMESSISPYLQLGSQDNLNVSEARHFSSLFTLMPYQQVRRRHQVRFLRRGAYDLGNAALTAGDVLGLFQGTREQSMQVPVLVFPRLLEDRDLPPPLSLLLGECLTRRPLLTDPFQVRGIRDYRMGDPVRDIHWPATARMGQAQVRLFDYTACTRLMVILNGQRTDDQWGARMMDDEARDVEYGISVAATVCVRALRQGLAAGFAANLPVDEEKDGVVLLPAGGAEREEALLTALARLKIRRTLRFPYFLQTLTDLQDVDVLVLSCYDSADLRAAMDTLRGRGNRVTLHVLERQGGAP